MDASERIEKVLWQALASGGGQSADAPPRLREAVAHAVFPGGARVRPRLCLSVWQACDGTRGEPALAAAAAIELLHCASLVHDDLPCFDNAQTRRGKPSVHAAYGERLAVLAGDALIVLAFETLARGCAAAPETVGPLFTAVGGGVGMPRGICAGQAWECEPAADLRAYQQSKTGALFAAATMAGAAAAGHDPAPWAQLGERLGEAYQVADDLRDVASDAADLGKPVGQDALLGRPSAAADLGIAGATARLKALVQAAVDAIPRCPGAPALEALVRAEAARILPRALARYAA